METMGLKWDHLVKKCAKIKIILVFMIRIRPSQFTVAPPILLTLDDLRVILAVPQHHMLDIPFFLRPANVLVCRSTTHESMISPMISRIFTLHALQGIPGGL